VGDLIRIKEGCGEEGKIAIVTKWPLEDDRFFCCAFLEGSRTVVSLYWVEVISEGG
jgi:hypothetical protein